MGDISWCDQLTGDPLLLLLLLYTSGDYTPDLAALLSADVIIATPEKWDGISRNWQSRGYVKKVGLSSHVHSETPVRFASSTAQVGLAYMLRKLTTWVCLPLCVETSHTDLGFCHCSGLHKQTCVHSAFSLVLYRLVC